MTNSAWAVGLLTRGSETVQPVAGGEEGTELAAIEAASDAAMWAAMDRGREVYRITAAGTEMVLTPGLTAAGDVDLWGVHEAVLALART